MTRSKYRFVMAMLLTASLGCTLGRAADTGIGLPEIGAAVAASDPHAAHRHMMANNELKRSIVKYSVPAVKLVRDDGVEVSLDKELNDGRPVVVNFIYTTCTTICPLSSQEFSMLQDRLGTDRDKVHLVSISIDPERDTPAHLLEYAQHFRAGKEWQHYTGTVQASIEAQRAFNVYRGDKMSHTPVTLLRGPSGDSWVRLDGFATGDELYSEVQELRVTR
jgi:protein SCO1/2